MQIKFLNFLEIAQLFIAFERGEVEEKPEVFVIKTAGYVDSIRERIKHFITEANDIEEGLEKYYAKEAFHTFEVSNVISIRGELVIANDLQQIHNVYDIVDNLYLVKE